MTVLGALARRDETRALGQATVWGNWGDEYASTWSGNRVDSSNAMQLMSVYGCVRFISDGISTLPLDAYRDNSGVREEIGLPAWLEEPVVGLHRVAWLTQLLSSLLLDGNAFVAIMRGPSGGILELIPLNATKCDVRREQGHRAVYVDGHPAPWPVLHIPGLMLAGKEVGCSPVECARQTIGAGMGLAEFGARFIGQGSVLSGVIEDPSDFNPQKAKDTAKLWANLHSGKAKAHLPGVLMGGMSWKPTGVTNEQAQFLQTRGFTDSQIAGQMFLTDPTELGIPSPPGQSLTYANLEQRNTRKVEVTFLPWLVRLETALSGLLAKPRYVKFNVDALLRADAHTRWQTHAIGLENRVVTRNEVRQLEDMPPLPEAQGGLIPEPPAALPPPKIQRSIERDEHGRPLRIVEERSA